MFDDPLPFEKLGDKARLVLSKGYFGIFDFTVFNDTIIKGQTFFEHTTFGHTVSTQ
jgi:hypothetical protein